MWKFYYLKSHPFWQYPRNIKINITNNRHFASVYLLGWLDYRLLYGQRHDNRLAHKQSLVKVTFSNFTIYFLFDRLPCSFSVGVLPFSTLVGPTQEERPPLSSGRLIAAVFNFILSHILKCPTIVPWKTLDYRLLQIVIFLAVRHYRYAPGFKVLHKKDTAITGLG